MTKKIKQATWHVTVAVPGNPTRVALPKFLNRQQRWQQQVPISRPLLKLHHFLFQTARSRSNQERWRTGRASSWEFKRTNPLLSAAEENRCWRSWRVFSNAILSCTLLSSLLCPLIFPRPPTTSLPLLKVCHLRICFDGFQVSATMASSFFSLFSLMEWLFVCFCCQWLNWESPEKRAIVFWSELRSIWNLMFICMLPCLILLLIHLEVHTLLINTSLPFVYLNFCHLLNTLMIYCNVAFSGMCCVFRFSVRKMLRLVRAINRSQFQMIE